MGSGVSCGSFGVVMNGGNFQIANSDVDQPESTSELTVTETTAAMWRYCCQASLFEMPVRVTGSSDEISVTVTGECVIPTELTQHGFCSARYMYLPLFFD